LESLIVIDGAFCLVEKKKKEREERRRSLHLDWIWRTETSTRWDPLSEAQAM
jgi:hypothetical protein